MVSRRHGESSSFLCVNATPHESELLDPDAVQAANIDTHRFINPEPSVGINGAKKLGQVTPAIKKLYH
jgi:hypothetical protein